MLMSEILMFLPMLCHELYIMEAIHELCQKIKIPVQQNLESLLQIWWDGQARSIVVRLISIV